MPETDYNSDYPGSIDFPGPRNLPEIRDAIEARKPSIYSVYENDNINPDQQHDSFYSEPTSTEPTCTFLTQDVSSDEDDNNSYAVEICEVFDPPEGFKDLARWSSKSSLEVISPLKTENNR